MTGIYLSPLERIIRFVVQAIYMESGFLNHHHVLTGFADSYEPSSILFNSFVTAKSPLLVNASTTRTVSHGDVSWSVGCHGNEVADIYVYDVFGTIIAEYHSGTPIYCTNVFAKKMTQTLCPPSVFTGLMRLMVQAIYGSRRNDYTGPPANVQPYLDIDTGTVNEFGNPVSARLLTGFNNSGIYKDPGGEYWIITMGSSRVFARKLNSFLYGTDVAARVMPGGGYDPMVEAYVLATVKPAGTQSDIGANPVTSPWNALAYGWKFNNAGNKASIVAHKFVTDIPCTVGTGGGATAGTAYGIETQLVTVVFGWDALAGLPVIASSTVVSTGKHIPYRQNKLFYPAWGVNKMQCLLPGSADGQGNKSATLNCPIYCYYDLSDNLVTFEASNGLYTSQAATTYTPPSRPNFEQAGMAKTDLCGIANKWTRITYPTGFNTVANGFASSFSAESIAPSRNYAGGTITWTDAWYEMEPYADMEARGYSVPSTNPGEARFRNTWTTGAPASNFQTNYASPIDNYTGAMVLPFFDAEAAFICEFTHTSNSGETDFSRKCGAGQQVYAEVWSWSPTPTFHLIAHVSDNIRHVSVSGPGTFATTSATAGEWAAIKASRDVTREKTQRAILYSPRYSGGYAVVYSETDGSSAPPIMELDNLFVVAFSDPFINYPMYVYSGYNTGVKYSLMGTVIGNDAAWPIAGDLTPVGWA